MSLPDSNRKGDFGTRRKIDENAHWNWDKAEIEASANQFVLQDVVESQDIPAEDERSDPHSEIDSDYAIMDIRTH